MSGECGCYTQVLQQWVLGSGICFDIRTAGRGSNTGGMTFNLMSTIAAIYRTLLPPALPTTCSWWLRGQLLVFRLTRCRSIAQWTHPKDPDASLGHNVSSSSPGYERIIIAACARPSLIINSQSKLWRLAPRRPRRSGDARMLQASKLQVSDHAERLRGKQRELVTSLKVDEGRRRSPLPATCNLKPLIAV